VLGQGTSTPASNRATALEDGGLALLDISGALRNDVGVDVAVRNVSPDRIVEPALLERLAKQLKTLLELLEPDDHIGCCLLDRRRRLLRRANPTVDRFWHRFANSQKLSLTPLVPG
jgi:hypothetical protein